MASNHHEGGTLPGEPSSPDMHAHATIQPNQRYRSLDVLRGIALLGALLVSVWVFGGYTSNQQHNLLLHPSGGNYRLYAAVSLLTEGKMRALIALVLGASLVLYLRRQQQADISKAHDLYVRRMLWLIGFGIVNAVLLLWQNDLLFHLGVMGILTLPFIQASPRGLLTAALVALLIFCGKQYWNYADDKKALRKYEAVIAVEKKFREDSASRARKDSIAMAAGKAAGIAVNDTAAGKAKKDSLTKEQEQDKQAWEGRLKGMKYDPKNDEGDKKSMRKTSYSDVWNYLLPKTQSREAQWTYRIGIWELGMMILLGMALLKLGYFDNRYKTSRYLLIAVAGIGIGLLLGWYRLYFNNASLLDYTKYIKSHWLPYDIFVPLERSMMALGYASLAIWLLRLNVFNWLWNALAAAGRMSLSNYLIQSIAGTLFFTGIGMNYYGQLPQWQLYLFVLELWLVQIVFSIFWLKFFNLGPAEWLWRSLSEKKKLPFKKDMSAVQTNPAFVNP